MGLLPCSLEALASSILLDLPAFSPLELRPRPRHRVLEEVGGLGVEVVHDPDDLGGVLQSFAEPNGVLGVGGCRAAAVEASDRREVGGGVVGIGG